MSSKDTVQDNRVYLGVPILAGLLAILAVACSAGSDVPTEMRAASFLVGDSATVVVNGSNGRIVVSSGEDGAVGVEATLRKPDDLSYEVGRDGDTITVTARVEDQSIFNFGDSPGADIEVTAPPNTRVELRTSNGSVYVYGMTRSGTVSSSNGKIVMQDTSGEFEVTTSNGSVEIARASGTFAVRTTNGRIKFDGEIVPGGKNRMTTSNGSVDIRLDGSPSVVVDASTQNGSVSTDLPVLAKAIDAKRHLVGTIGGGDAELFVRTSNGSVMIQ